MSHVSTLAQRWILVLREWRAEIHAQRAWRRALLAEEFTDWDSLTSRRHFALFPPEDLHRCREDLNLQAEQDAEAGRFLFRDRSRPCFGCGRGASELEWVFYQSPVWTWTEQCGRAGWIVYCPRCDNQVSFHRTRMS